MAGRGACSWPLRSGEWCDTVKLFKLLAKRIGMAAEGGSDTRRQSNHSSSTLYCCAELICLS
jgi:hypothetical protein